MPPVGFEPTISAGERPKTYALDLAATGPVRCTSTNQICGIESDVTLLTDLWAWAKTFALLKLCLIHSKELEFL